MISPETYLAVKKLQIRVDRALAGVWSGLAPSPFRGAGLEFEEVRPYVPGDDVRDFDWKVTARTGHPYVKKYVEDRERSFWLAVDRSPSMRFRSGELSKYDAAVEIAAVFALHAAHRLDRVGLLSLGGSGHRFLPALKGRGHARRLLAELMSDDVSEPNRADGFDRLRRAARRRALAVVVSDGLDSEWIDRVCGLRSRHEAIFVHVIDPWERNLPDAGLVRWVDVETGETVVVDCGSAKLRREYALKAEARERAIHLRLARHRVRWIPIVTDRSPAIGLLRGLSGRVT